MSDEKRRLDYDSMYWTLRGQWNQYRQQRGKTAYAKMRAERERLRQEARQRLEREREVRRKAREEQQRIAQEKLRWEMVKEKWRRERQGKERVISLLAEKEKNYWGRTRNVAEQQEEKEKEARSSNPPEGEQTESQG